jgi:hypothetical protein
VRARGLLGWTLLLGAKDKQASKWNNFETDAFVNGCVLYKRQLVDSKDVPSRVKDDDVRAFLLLLYRNQVLEIEAMDRQDQLEWLARNHESAIRAKDSEVAALKEQVRLRDQLVSRLKESAESQELECLSRRLVDVDSRAVPQAPSSPLPVMGASFMNSPRGPIPLSNRIKGIAESILSTGVRNSPRAARPPSTAESFTQPDVDATPRKPRKTKKGHTSRHVPPLPLLSVKGTTSAYASSTRRSRTENPPESKQGRRMIQAKAAVKLRP